MKSLDLSFRNITFSKQSSCEWSSWFGKDLLYINLEDYYSGDLYVWIYSCPGYHRHSPKPIELKQGMISLADETKIELSSLILIKNYEAISLRD